MLGAGMDARQLLGVFETVLSGDEVWVVLARGNLFAVIGHAFARPGIEIHHRQIGEAAVKFELLDRTQSADQSLQFHLQISVRDII